MGRKLGRQQQPPTTGSTNHTTRPTRRESQKLRDKQHPSSCPSLKKPKYPTLSVTCIPPRLVRTRYSTQRPDPFPTTTTTTTTMADNNKKGGHKQKESILELTKLMDAAVRVKCLGGRELRGVLKGFDDLVNIVLDDCEEFLRGTFCCCAVVLEKLFCRCCSLVCRVCFCYFALFLNNCCYCPILCVCLMIYRSGGLSSTHTTKTQTRTGRHSGATSVAHFPGRGHGRNCQSLFSSRGRRRRRGRRRVE